MTLFQLGSFVLHSDTVSQWKIDCDALSGSELDALAFMLAEVLPPFGKVEGVARGGLSLAVRLRKHSGSGPLLIVDDVWTTGRSMEGQRAGRDAVGAVIFARNAVPSWVTPLFQMRTA